MAMGLPLLLWLSYGTCKTRRWLWMLVILIVGTVLPFALQRAVWASAAAAVGISMVTWPKRGPILVASVVLVLTAARFMMPPTLEKRLEDRLTEKQTVTFRFRLLDASYAIIDEHLATGVGFYRFNDLAKRRFGEWVSSHNTPLTLFAELGLLGFLPYVTIFVLLLFESAKTYWYQPGYRVLIGGLWGIMAAYMIAAVAVDIRAVFYLNGLHFALWGMVLGMTRRQAVVRHETRAPLRVQSPALSG
jgi:O-antigen ligase